MTHETAVCFRRLSRMEKMRKSPSAADAKSPADMELPSNPEQLKGRLAALKEQEAKLQAKRNNLRLQRESTAAEYIRMKKLLKEKEEKNGTGKKTGVGKKTGILMNPELRRLLEKVSQYENAIAEISKCLDTATAMADNINIAKIRADCRELLVNACVFQKAVLRLERQSGFDRDVILDAHDDIKEAMQETEDLHNEIMKSMTEMTAVDAERDLEELEKQLELEYPADNDDDATTTNDTVQYTPPVVATTNSPLLADAMLPTVPVTPVRIPKASSVDRHTRMQEAAGF